MTNWNLFRHWKLPFTPPQKIKKHNKLSWKVSLKQTSWLNEAIHILTDSRYTYFHLFQSHYHLFKITDQFAPQFNSFTKSCSANCHTTFWCYESILYLLQSLSLCNYSLLSQEWRQLLIHKMQNFVKTSNLNKTDIFSPFLPVAQN